jgi:anti-sigma regulatory factor (Ser/Thr protein kinase)
MPAPDQASPADYQPMTTTYERTAMTAGTAVPLAWSHAFPAVPAQIREARRFLAGILAGCPAADDATLCLSELASNATVHSQSREPGGHFTVRAGINAGRLRVEVQDEGGPWTWPVHHRDGQHGRGLLIVARLARDWGRAGDSETGWSMWFEMDVPMTSRRAGEHQHRTIALARRPPAPASQHRSTTPGRETTMPEPSTTAAATAQYDAERMRAMAADLTAHGLTTHLTDSRAGLDLTATLSPSGKREAELILDEDGYAELRYWNPPGTPPAQVTATALRALQAVTSTAPSLSLNEPKSTPGTS